jgi:signal transduction histidine kinase
MAAAGEQQIMRSLWVSRLGIALTALVGLLAFYLYLRQSNALKQAGREQETLKQERDNLESLVRERTASLAKLATYLQQVRGRARPSGARAARRTGLAADRRQARRGPHQVPPRRPRPEVLQRLQHLTETLNSGIALKRRIVEDLRPSSLSNLGLLPSLEILTREFAERSDLGVQTHLAPVDLDESSQLTLYRLVQEALTNIGKYAQAKHVSVELQHQGPYALLQVHDDGIGFDPRPIGGSSHGLEGMRHRVEATGGACWSNPPRAQVRGSPPICPTNPASSTA